MKQNLRLNTGDYIPAIGFGTWQILLNNRAENAVTSALELGYRLLDTAFVYGNEKGVGAAVNKSSVPRADIFLTTKLWNRNQGYDNALDAFDRSLNSLRVDYIDLYLIHWPQSKELTRESWRAMEVIYQSGKSKAIGVSNYDVSQLKDLMDAAVTPPAVNQIEFHPFVYSQQKPIVDYCQENNIVVEAYSPLARAAHWGEPLFNELAHKYDKTIAQVLLRWAIQHGTVPIPKSSHADRMKENLDVFDFKLDNKDMQKLNSLSTGQSVI